MISNYEKQVDIGKAHFLKYDQEALSAKFHLDLDKDYIYLTYLNTPCKIDRPSGTVFEKTSDGFAECRSYETVMTIYDMLCHGQETELPPLGGKWTPIANFAAAGASPSAEIFSQKYADFFSGKVDAVISLQKSRHFLSSRFCFSSGKAMRNSRRRLKSCGMIRRCVI